MKTPKANEEEKKTIIRRKKTIRSRKWQEQGRQRVQPSFFTWFGLKFKKMKKKRNPHFLAEKIRNNYVGSYDAWPCEIVVDLTFGNIQIFKFKYSNIQIFYLKNQPTGNNPHHLTFYFAIPKLFTINISTTDDNKLFEFFVWWQVSLDFHFFSTPFFPCDGECKSKTTFEKENNFGV